MNNNKSKFGPNDIIPTQFTMKNRWAVTSGLEADENGEPTSKVYIDVEAGWGVRNDDPRTLCSFNEAERAVKEKRGYTTVYIADKDDDMELVDKVNRTLCPIHDLPQAFVATYWELKGWEPMLKNCDQAEPFDLPELVPHLAHLVFRHHHEYDGAIMEGQELAELLNLDAQMRGDSTIYTESWVIDRMEKSLNSSNPIVIPGYICNAVMVSRTEYFPNEPERVPEDGVYYFGKLRRGVKI